MMRLRFQVLEYRLKIQLRTEGVVFLLALFVHSPSSLKSHML